jgi:hypothetical protein
MVARFAPALLGFAVIPNGIQVAAAAGTNQVLISARGIRIARYCAML